MSHRPEKLAEAIKQEMSGLLKGELKDPRIGFATITGVDVTSDLQYAKIHVSVMGSTEEQESTMYALQNAQGFIRKELGKRVRLRRVPEITFKLDESMEYGAKMMEILKGLNNPHE